MDLFQTLFGIIDNVTVDFAIKYSAAIIANVVPVLSVALTLSFILYAILIIYGVVDTPLLAFLKKSSIIAIIFSIGSAGGLYQTKFADAIIKTPDEFATALVSQSNKTKLPAANLIDSVASIGFGKAGDALEEASVLTGDIAPVFFAAIIFLATVILVGIGGAFILVAKVSLALIVSFGPLFIFFLMFKSTAQRFEAWAGQVLNYGLLVVMVSAVFGLFMGLFNGYMSSFDLESQNAMYALGGCLLISFIGVIVLLKLPEIAAALGGGIAAAGLHDFANAYKALKSSSGFNAGRAGASAAWNKYKKSRSSSPSPKS